MIWILGLFLALAVSIFLATPFLTPTKSEPIDDEILEYRQALKKVNAQILKGNKDDILIEQKQDLEQR